MSETQQSVELHRLIKQFAMKTPETDEIVKAYYDDQRESFGEIIEHAERLERERDEAREEVEQWKLNFIPFAAIFMAEYGESRYGKGFMRSNHYDLLKKAGARMTGFKRAENEKEQKL